MKYINCLAVFICSLYIVACSSGSAGGVNPNAYGNLQSYLSIALGGTSPGVTYPVPVLQSFVESGVCVNIVPAVPVLDKKFLTASRHFGSDLCNANKTYINNHNDLFGAVSGHLNDFVTSNSAGVSAVKMYRITYNTPGQANRYSGGGVTNETVSGLVIVPQGISASNVKGVVLFYHPTVFSKHDVPSMQDSKMQIMLASIYASQGYITIAPDYVGQGVDSSVMHPYVLYPQNNALNGINMLKATRQFLATESALSGSVVPASQYMNLYISSYSEGAPYALWASRMLQGSEANMLANNNLNLKLTVGIEGAYDLTGSMIPFSYSTSNNSQLSNLNYYNASPGMLESSDFYLPGIAAIPPSFPKIESGMQQTLANIYMAVSKSSLSGYAFVSFITYDFTKAAFPLFFPNNNFFNMSGCLSLESYVTSAVLTSLPSIVRKDCPIRDTLANLFMNPSYSDAAISGTIAPSAMWNTSFFTGNESASVLVDNLYNGGVSNNSVDRFAQPVLSDPQVMALIGKADTWSYGTNSKTAIIYMNYDSAVTNKSGIRACSSDGVYGRSPGKVKCLTLDNTQLYTSQLFALGATAVQIPLMIDHSQAPYILSLIALNQIKNNP